MSLDKRSIPIIGSLALIAIAGFLLLSKKTPPADTDSTSRSSSASIASPVSNLDERLRICEAIPNGTTQKITETTRLFINLPEDIYPSANRQFTMDGATAGDVTTSEGPTKGVSVEDFLKNKCSTHYYDFEGKGTVDLRVKSAVSGVPDYEIHFIVED